MEILYSFVEPSLESKLPFISIVLVSLIALLGGYFKFKISPLRGKKLPPGSLGLPLVGESLSFIREQREDKINEWFQKRMDKYGPVFKTSLMGSNVVILTGQASNRFIFSGSNNGIASNQVATAASILGKNSIFEASESRHKIFRGALMKYLKTESIQRFVGEMDSLIQQQLLLELDGKDSVKAVTLLKIITFKVTCSLFYGLPEGREKDAFFEDFILLAKGLWCIPLNFPGTVFYQALQARGRIHKLFSTMVQRRKKQLEETNMTSHDDIISSFLNLRDEFGEPLREDVIIDNMISTMIASHDTNTSLLSVFVRHLARDPEVYNKVLEEQEEVVKAREGRNGNITWSDLQKMKYTWRVAQELMRLTPPAIGNFKCTSRDISFDGFDIPKGWQVFWVTFGTHMDKNIFENPEKFDPSRFEGSSKSIPPYTYVPFGAGPRICPGVEFARIELLLIIHHMITTYQWTEMIPDEPIEREPMPYPAMGLPIKLRRRKDAKEAIF